VYLTGDCLKTEDFLPGCGFGVAGSKAVPSTSLSPQRWRRTDMSTPCTTPRIAVSQGLHHTPQQPRLLCNRLQVFRSAHTAHCGRRVGPERWLRVVPSGNTCSPRNGSCQCCTMCPSRHGSNSSQFVVEGSKWPTKTQNRRNLLILLGQYIVQLFNSLILHDNEIGTFHTDCTGTPSRVAGGGRTRAGGTA